MNDAMSILERHGAILRDGHFVYTSGRHGSVYVNKDSVYPHTMSVDQLCSEVAFRFRRSGIDAVVGPAIGGVILAQWTARNLIYENGRNALALYAEQSPDGRFEFRRGYDRLIADRRVLIVEDVLTTGGSVRSVIEAVRAAQGTVAGVACLVNRGGMTAEQVGSPVPIVSLVDLPLESWDAAECPLCAAGVPVNVEVGKGREFVNRTMNRTCGDCGVSPGQLHIPGCDVEQCPDCGGQMISCDCPPEESHKRPRLPWTGEWPGKVECREYGWYCKWAEGGRGRVPCSPDDPNVAGEDLNRLVCEGVWNAERGRFVRPGH